jgi:hypothetical protein
LLLAHSSGTESLITYCKVSEDTGGGGNSPTVDRSFGIGKTNSRIDVKIRYLLVTSEHRHFYHDLVYQNKSFYFVCLIS